MGFSCMETADFWVHSWILFCREMDLSCLLLANLSLGKASLELGLPLMCKQKSVLQL